MTIDRTRRRWRMLAVSGVIAGILLTGAMTAEARPSADALTATMCGSWRPDTAMHYTSNHLLGVYLQARTCTDHYDYRAAVHNYSPNGVGDRAYGIESCAGEGTVMWRGVYIGPGQTWASPPRQGDFYYASFAGVIYKANQPGVVDLPARTGCVRG